MASRCKTIKTILFSILAIGIHHNIYASGDDGPYDSFVSRQQPDVHLDAYAGGSLGIILSTYPRIFLYPAWRTILLGKKEILTANESGNLEKACCSTVSDWVNVGNPESAQAKWLATRAKVTLEPPRVNLAVVRATAADSYTYYRNCPDDAYLFAQSTLNQLAKQPDATPSRLKDWVAAQDAVFEFCGYVPGATARYNQKPVPEPEIPEPLASKEPKLWKQWRDYQIASASFYSGDNSQASDLFDAIGNEAGHPMQKWGAYLSLRAQIRNVTIPTEMNSQTHDTDDANIEDIKAAAQKILKNPKLAEVHEYTRASLRTLEFRMTPEKRFKELSDQLNDWRKSPFRDDTLGDWQRLANNFIESEYNADSIEQINAMREKYSYFDWMRTIQRCSGTLPQNKVSTCEAEASHAEDTWHKALKAKSPEVNAWFVAVLMTAKQADPEMLAQANKVPETAPEFLTVQYYVARLMRQSGQVSQARKLVDTQLAQSFESQSALNLFLQERFALANSLEDASLYLTRGVAARVNPDTKEIKLTTLSRNSLGADGKYWLNNALSITDLLKLTEIDTLPLSLRKNIAIAAWSRADLLGKSDLADAAAKKVVLLAPELKKYTDAYLGTRDAMTRTHWLLLGEVNNRISPEINWTSSPANFKVSPDEAVADMWCRLGSESRDDWEFNSEKSPPTPQVSANAELRDNEIAALKNVGTATGFFSKHVLSYAKAHPDDPDVPWLLYVSIHSSRGGCVDPDNANTSRSSHNLLHTRYRKSKWAAKAPYWYK